MRAANLSSAIPAASSNLRGLPHPETIFLLDDCGASEWAGMRAGSIAADVRLMSFRSLTVSALRELSPRTIVTPAIRNGFDAVEVARRLEAARYGGVLVVGVEPRLDSEVVARDVRDNCPSVRCTFYTYPAVGAEAVSGMSARGTLHD